MSHCLSKMTAPAKGVRAIRSRFPLRTKFQEVAAGARRGRTAIPTPERGSSGLMSADRIGIVGPPLVAGNVSLLRPCQTTVERLEEAGEMVVALAVHDPFADTDQVCRVGRVDVEIRLRVLLHDERRVGDVLRRIRPDVFAGAGLTGAEGRAPVGVSLRRREAAQVVDLRCVAADSLRRCGHAAYVALGIARSERCLRLESLRG